MSGDEPELVAVCLAVRAGREDPGVFDATFARARVYVQRRPDRPGVVARRMPDMGSWVLAFSTEERLARACGEVPWLSTTGADLLDQLPHGLGVLVDVGDPHGLPLLPQPAGQARFAGAVLPPRPQGEAAHDG